MIVFITVACGLSPASSASTGCRSGARSPCSCWRRLLGLVSPGPPRRDRQRSWRGGGLVVPLAVVAALDGLGRVGRPGADRGQPLDALRRAVRDPGAAPARRPARRSSCGLGRRAVVVFAGYLVGPAARARRRRRCSSSSACNEPLGYINGQAGYLLLGVWPLVALAERARNHLVSGAGDRRGDGARRPRGARPDPGDRARRDRQRRHAGALCSRAGARAFGRCWRSRRAWCRRPRPSSTCSTAARPGPAARTTRRSDGASVAARRPRSDGRGLGAAALARRGQLAGLRRGPGGAAVSTVALVALLSAGAGGERRGDRQPRGQRPRPVRRVQNLGVTATAETRSRFTSGGGNRYDYWRVALDQFAGPAAARASAPATTTAPTSSSDDPRGHPPAAQPPAPDARASSGSWGALGLLLFLGGAGRRGSRAGPGRAARAPPTSGSRWRREACSWCGWSTRASTGCT